MKEPKIRFKGFQGEWEEAPFSEIANRTSASASSSLFPGVEFEDINSGEGTLNKDVRKKNIIKIGKQFSNGDVLFGKLRPYLKNILLAKFTGVAIGDFWVLHPQKVTSELLYILLNSREFMRIANISSGSKMPRADWNLVSSTSFAYPEAKEEQCKLGSYFQHLDSLIQSTTKKIESLKQVKAASLQSMFPQEGETTPRVRFKGFEGEWEETPFSETFDYLKNNSLSRAELSDGGVVMNIHYGDVLIKYGECVDVGKEVKTFVKEEHVAKRLHQSCAITNGDIIFADAAEDNTVGKCSEIIAKEDDAIISGLHTIPCRPMKQFATRYLGYYLNSNAYHNQLLPHIQGTKISSISKKAISQTHINSPLDIAEQRAIASYFTTLDRQITLQSQRLEKLKQIKAACLDNMFV